MKCPTTPFALICRGAVLGASVGGMLAGLYAALVPPMVGVLLALTNSANARLFDALIGAGIFALCSGPFALLLGILPALLLGAFSGLWIGLLVAPWRGQLSNRGAALIGLLVAIATVIVGNLVLGPGMIEPARTGFGRYRLYLFWVGGPSVLILIGLPVVGWVLQQDVQMIVPSVLRGRKRL